MKKTTQTESRSAASNKQATANKKGKASVRTRSSTGSSVAKKPVTTVLRGRKSTNVEKSSSGSAEKLFKKDDWKFGEWEGDGEEANQSDSDSSSEDDEVTIKAQPKGELFGSDDDSDDDAYEDMDDEFDADSLPDAPGFESSDADSDDDELAIEEKAARMEERQRRHERESAADLAEQVRGEKDDNEKQIDIFHLPATLQTQATDLDAVRTRMHEIVRVLSRFSELREPGRPRSDYTEQLTVDVCNYYGYAPFLAQLFLSLFPVSEALEFFEANERPRPVTLRTNTLKSRRQDLAKALIARGVNLDPVEWCDDGLQVFENQVPLGGTPEYLAGHYMLQTAASWLPVMAMDPRPNERVLDMCSAPGGKTTHIAARMRNTGQLFANDAKKERLTGLIANVHRLGVRNCVVCNYDGRKLGKLIDNFDRVLLDAPCAGLGVVTRDPSVKTQRGKDDIRKLAHLQKELLLSAIDLLRPRRGEQDDCGVLIYSTCSLSVEENEAVINYALARRHVKLVDPGLPFGRPGFVRFRAHLFHPSVAHSRRFYPHLHNTDGFFVAKFVKTENGPKALDSAATTTARKAADGKPLKKKTPLVFAEAAAAAAVSGESTAAHSPRVANKRSVKNGKPSPAAAPTKRKPAKQAVTTAPLKKGAAAFAKKPAAAPAKKTTTATKKTSADAVAKNSQQKQGKTPSKRARRS